MCVQRCPKCNEENLHYLKYNLEKVGVGVNYPTIKELVVGRLPPK